MSDFLSDQPAGVSKSHLSSNNPFRTRAISPSIPTQSPTSPFFDVPATTVPPRPVSRNPFLDPSNETPAADRLISFDDTNLKTKTAGESELDDIFSSLKMDDDTKAASAVGVPPRKPSDGRPLPSSSSVPGQGRSGGRGRGGPPPPRGKNVPLRQSPPSVHRPTRSQEEALKNRKGSGKGSSESAAGSSSASQRPAPSSRPRRNSESSVADVHDISLSGGEKAIRNIRRERSGRPPNRRNDIIDQMDATSIFGTVFHHDGPFDALNPHRNRKGSRRAPMQAFPKDSLNNVIGGTGPLNARPDHRTFMGQGDEEAFREFAGARAGISDADKFGSSSNRVGVFDPLQRSSTLHGEQSLGLGTSTFLEGTPAARTAIQRREAERAQDVQDNPLQRKKSLAQRFRSINRGPREHGPTRAYSSEGTRISGHTGSGRYTAETSPFDEFDPKKGDDGFTVRRKGSVALASPSSPPRLSGLERRSTTDGSVDMSATPPSTNEGNGTTTSTDDAQKASGGLLARVKSLKGGSRRPAPPPPIAKDL